MLEVTLLQSFPGYVTILFFVAVTLLGVALYYHCFLLYSETLLKARGPILLPPVNLPREGIDFVSPIVTEHATAMELSPVTEPSQESSDASSATSSVASAPSSPLTAAQEERLREYKYHFGLSVRETKVLCEILQNHSIDEMADRLFVSPRTIKFQISSLLKKTGTSS